MKTSLEKLPKSQMVITIEIPVSEFQGFIEKAIFNLGKDLEIEGFRKGKAPKEIIEKEIGQEKILKEAAEECVKESYPKAVSENKIEPLGQPEIEILKMAPGNPFEFKAKVSTLPEIKLPDYKQITSQVKKREVAVTKEEIERLKIEKERVEKERVRQEILERIAEKSEIEIPETLIESEKGRILENLKQQVSQMLQIGFEDYLKKIQKTEKELLDSLLPEAQKRVKNSLVLREIEKREMIEVSDEEIKRFLEQHPHLKNLDPSPLAKGERVDPKRIGEYAKEVIRNEKTFQLLENLIK